MAEEKNDTYRLGQGAEDRMVGADTGGDTCALTDASCRAGDALEGIGKGFEEKLIDGIETILEAVFTGFLDIPLLMFIGLGPESPSEIITFLQTNLLPLTRWFMTLALILFAGALIFRATSERLMRRAGRYALVTLVATGGSYYIGFQLCYTADLYTSWVIGESMGDGDMARTVIDLLTFFGGGGILFSIVLGVVVFFLGLIQGLQMVIALIMLPLLIGSFPLVAAASFTPTGRSMMRHYTSSILALILFKPVVGTIYALGFHLLGAGNPFEAHGLADTVASVYNLMFGIAILFIGVMALPRLLKVLTPVIAEAEVAVSGGQHVSRVTEGALKTATGAVGYATGGIAAAGLSSGVKAMNSHAKGADAPTGSVGTPNTGSPSNRGPSGWDTQATGSTGTPQTGRTGAQGTPGTPGAAGMSAGTTSTQTGSTGSPSAARPAPKVPTDTGAQK